MNLRQKVNVNERRKFLAGILVSQIAPEISFNMENYFNGTRKKTLSNLNCNNNKYVWRYHGEWVRERERENVMHANFHLDDGVLAAYGGIWTLVHIMQHFSFVLL
jgi:hypothetical protein